jgi:hypothetical protein
MHTILASHVLLTFVPFLAATANPNDIPFFLSTKLDSSTTDERRTKSTSSTVAAASKKKNDTTVQDLLALGDPVQVLSKYEDRAAKLAQEFEEEMVRF